MANNKFKKFISFMPAAVMLIIPLSGTATIYENLIICDACREEIANDCDYYGNM